MTITLTLVTLTLALLAAIAARSVVAALLGLLMIASWACAGFQLTVVTVALALSVTIVSTALGAIVDRCCFETVSASICTMFGAVAGTGLVLHSELFLHLFTADLSTYAAAEQITIVSGVVAVAIESTVQVAVPLLLFLALMELPLVWLGKTQGMALGPLAASLRPLVLVLLLSMSGRMIAERVLAPLVTGPLSQV